jgi:hypothetical protein
LLHEQGTSSFIIESLFENILFKQGKVNSIPTLQLFQFSYLVSAEMLFFKGWVVMVHAMIAFGGEEE